MRDVPAVRTEAGPSRESRTEMGLRACLLFILTTAITMLTQAAVGESVSARGCRLGCFEAPLEPQKMKNLGESRQTLDSTHRCRVSQHTKPHWRSRRPAEGDRGVCTGNIRCGRPPGAAYLGAVQTGEGPLSGHFRMTPSSHSRESRPLNTPLCDGRSPLGPVPWSAAHRAGQGLAARL
jgi:hypothetical protein